MKKVILGLMVVAVSGCETLSVGENNNNYDLCKKRLKIVDRCNQDLCRKSNVIVYVCS